MHKLSHLCVCTSFLLNHHRKIMEENVTPTKVYNRNSVCRLCGGSYDSRHMLRVFGKAGIEKDIRRKVQTTCGIHISEDDCLSKLLCRKCEAFVFKVTDFRQRSLNIQIQIEQQCSVKRCVEISPSSKQPSKRPASATRQSSAKQLAFNDAPDVENDELRYCKPQRTSNACFATEAAGRKRFCSAPCNARTSSERGSNGQT